MISRYVCKRRHDASCGSLYPVRTSELLDLLVRTDTSNVVELGVGRGSRGFSDPLVLVRCPLCGSPISDCCCVPGKDY